VSSAIEGDKILGWAPNHYSRLAGSVDAMELYDLGDNVEIVRSLNPRLMMVLTSEDARHFKSGALLSSKPMLGGFLPATPAAIDVVHLGAISCGENTVARYSKLRRKIR
jgi:hypothetical protein